MIYRANVKQEQPRGLLGGMGAQWGRKKKTEESACDHTHNLRSESDGTSQYNKNKLSRRDQQREVRGKRSREDERTWSRGAGERANAAFHIE